MRFILLSRWGDFLHELHVYEATHREEINGEDALELTIDEPLAWGDRIVWDDNGMWRENVVNETEQTHDGGQVYTVVAVDSLMWDFTLRQIKYTRWNGADCRYALTELLKLNPSWEIGECKSTSTKNLEYERESAYRALLETAGTFNCEIKREIEVDKTGVTKRTVSYVEHIGQERNIRFDYGYGLYGVVKTINPEPVLTACFGYGSSVGDEDLTCYVTNDEALPVWGLSDGQGGVMHAEGEFSDPDIEDMATLQQATTDYLNAHSAPSITYETQIPFASLQGARLGDTIAVIDQEFYPELRLLTRIGMMERNLITGETTNAVFGTVTSLLPDALARSFQQQKIIIRQNTTINNLKDDLSSTRDSLSRAQSDLASAQGNISDLQGDLRDAKNDLSAAQRDLAQAQRDADAAKKQANDLAAVVESQKGTISSLESDVSALQDDVNKLRDQLNEEVAVFTRAATGYNASTAINNAYMNCVVGGAPLTAAERNAVYSYYVYYQGAVNQGLARNYGMEQMYNAIMALPYSDEGGEEPSFDSPQSDMPEEG